MADPFMSLGPIRRGWIHKKGEKNRAWKKRYLEGGEVKGIIQARDINNVDIDSSHKSRENIFLIETDNRTYAMQAPDAKMRSQWIDAISSMRNVPNRTDGQKVFDDDVVGQKKKKAIFNDGGAQLGDTGEVVAVSPATKDPWFWTVREVVYWIEGLDLSNDWSKFIVDGFVDGETLIDEMMTVNDWREVGVTFKGDIDTLLGQTALLRST